MDPIYFWGAATLQNSDSHHLHDARERVSPHQLEETVSRALISFPLLRGRRRVRFGVRQSPQGLHLWTEDSRSELDSRATAAQGQNDFCFARQRFQTLAGSLSRAGEDPLRDAARQRLTLNRRSPNDGKKQRRFQQRKRIFQHP